MIRIDSLPSTALRRILAVVLLATLPPLAHPAKSGDTFRDWTVQCESAQKGTAQTCYIFQNLLLKQGQKRLLHMAVGYLAKSGKPAAFFTLPLGVSLPGGVSLSVDDGPPQRFRYERCEADGCLAPLILGDDLIRALKAGRQARVAFFDASRREISVPVSLLGFTAGYDTLVAP